MPRLRIRWGSDRYALGPYILAGRRLLLLRLGRLVMSVAWGRR